MATQRVLINDGSCKTCGSSLNHCDAGHCDVYINNLKDSLERLSRLSAYKLKKKNAKLRAALESIKPCRCPTHCKLHPFDLCDICEAKKALEGK